MQDEIVKHILFNAAELAELPGKKALAELKRAFPEATTLDFSRAITEIDQLTKPLAALQRYAWEEKMQRDRAKIATAEPAARAT